MPADIRPAHPRDIDALLLIENTVFETDRISRRSFRRFLDGSRASLLVAAGEDGAVWGYALTLFRRGSGVARLYSIAVAPGRAGKGLGRHLLAAAEATAEARGCRVLRLEVREENARAVALYERCGFRPIGRRNGYYADGAAALRFEKHLKTRKES